MACVVTATSASPSVRASTAKPSVLLADDSPAILEHVSKMLEASYEICAIVADGERVFEEIGKAKPDVIILDISMPRASGIDVARRLRDQGCDSKIMFLTVHDDPDFVEAALAAGASAYVVKYSLGTDLVPAIEAALAGKLFVSPSLGAGP